MTPRIVLFTQPGCFSCELMKIFIEAKELAFEERDASDPAIRQEMREKYESNEIPTLVLVSGDSHEVIPGFDPDLLDQLLDAAPSPDSVIES
jgi:glutaredoxin